MCVFACLLARVLQVRKADDRADALGWRQSKQIKKGDVILEVR